MSRTINRRAFLAHSAVLSAFALTGLPSRASAQSTLSAVEWGGDVVAAMKAIAAKQEAVAVNFSLFQGGAASVLPGIKAAWPRAPYDYVAGWEGSFSTMIKEDWLESITREQVPHLADIPSKVIMKDGAGAWKAVPRAVGGIYFGYRKDTSPLAVSSLDDLFSPQLKGKICWPGPTQCMMLQIVALALHEGGDERNMEPGWKAMKALAKTGNIARVATTDIEFSNSLSSGETSVGCFAEPGWAGVAKNFDVVPLTKQEGVPAFLYQSGFGVLKNRENTEETLRFINHCISPEMSALYAEIAGEAPLNVKAKMPDKLKHLSFSEDEMNKFVYIPDFDVVLGQQDAWAKRWENEIAPLL
ncbi:extracellular solute-binding protein [Alcaligenaceae bacterium CGII-47]|nr:extracellular solute-binding protein [Alcaligenaceae bacterium CGII-47]